MCTPMATSPHSPPPIYTIYTIYTHITLICACTSVDIYSH